MPVYLQNILWTGAIHLIIFLGLAVWADYVVRRAQALLPQVSNLNQQNHRKFSGEL